MTVEVQGCPHSSQELNVLFILNPTNWRASKYDWN